MENLQVVFGKSPALPGFSDGNVLTDSVVTESDALRMHFERQEKVRVLYRQADSSRRLKDAEKSRIQPFHDQKYEKGDLIMFLDKDDQWDGPAVVQGTESKTIFVSHNGTMKKVASCRARPWYDDTDQGDLLDDSNDESEIVIDCDETINLESDQFTDIEEFIDTDEEQVLEEKQEVVDRTGTETETEEHSDENRGEERRPKRFKSIEFKTRNNENSCRGKVVGVGKKNTKNVDKCWIEMENKEIEIVDFVRDIEQWKYIKKVHFDKDETDDKVAEKDATEMKTKESVRLKEISADAEGVFFLSRQDPVDVFPLLSTNIQRLRML